MQMLQKMIANHVLCRMRLPKPVNFFWVNYDVIIMRLGRLKLKGVGKPILCFVRNM